MTLLLAQTKPQFAVVKLALLWRASGVSGTFSTLHVNPGKRSQEKVPDTFVSARR
jgi:hypothetical protein